MKNYMKLSIILLFTFVLVACSKSDENSTKEQEDTSKSTEESNTKEETSPSEQKETEESEESKQQEPITPEEIPEYFLANNTEAIYNQTSDSFKQMVPLDQFERLGADFNEGVQSYELTHSFPTQDLTEYQWISDGGDKGIRALIAEDNTIEGIQLMPISSDPEGDEAYTKNEYQLPMAGEWYVFWGGTNELVNYHYALPVQRYAYDFVIVKDNFSYEGDPTKNESYYAFGMEVLAPGEGKVVSVENEIPDNKPGVETNAQEPLGNHVIIEHEHNEYSVIAHMKQGSVKVEEGDQVNAGDLLGLVGNSGNSSEPHIHYHVADSIEWEKATSIRIKLQNGEEPVRGESVIGIE
ncbi:M23 family metallopeptidase [Salirhabdus sp. Marseille-P4669]|uniref:M23 family metallopeptidase n=1 Tax=Salirhabdus sp. Marseille-P4669 TaxID=2042310 RepID=UPI001F3B5A3B|nr:M23 family metallopeptidase [Salirhabdus sp. Marseille-P4669]